MIASLFNRKNTLLILIFSNGFISFAFYFILKSRLLVSSFLIEDLQDAFLAGSLLSLLFFAGAQGHYFTSLKLQSDLEFETKLYWSLILTSLFLFILNLFLKNFILIFVISGFIRQAVLSFSKYLNNLHYYFIPTIEYFFLVLFIFSFPKHLSSLKVISLVSQGILIFGLLIIALNYLSSKISFRSLISFNKKNISTSFQLIFYSILTIFTPLIIRKILRLFELNDSELSNLFIIISVFSSISILFNTNYTGISKKLKIYFIEEKEKFELILKKAFKSNLYIVISLFVLLIVLKSQNFKPINFQFSVLALLLLNIFLKSFVVPYSNFLVQSNNLKKHYLRLSIWLISFVVILLISYFTNEFNFVLIADGLSWLFVYFILTDKSFKFW